MAPSAHLTEFTSQQNAKSFEEEHVKAPVRLRQINQDIVNIEARREG